MKKFITLEKGGTIGLENFTSRWVNSIGDLYWLAFQIGDLESLDKIKAIKATVVEMSEKAFNQTYEHQQIKKVTV